MISAHPIPCRLCGRDPFVKYSDVSKWTVVCCGSYLSMPETVRHLIEVKGDSMLEAFAAWSRIQFDVPNAAESKP